MPNYTQDTPFPLFTTIYAKWGRHTKKIIFGLKNANSGQGIALCTKCNIICQQKELLHGCEKLRTTRISIPQRQRMNADFETDRNHNQSAASEATTAPSGSTTSRSRVLA